MFARHVTKEISAYCHGELSSEESKQFAEHIIACEKCRTKYEEIKVGIKLAEQLPQLSAPEHMWKGLEAALATQPDDPRHEAWWRRHNLFAWPRLAAAAVGLLIVSLAASWVYNSPDPTIGPVHLVERPSWLVWRLTGTPKIGDVSIANRGQLAVGEWLETDETSSAHIKVESIGNVEIDTNTRVRLLASKKDEYRLELARGKMSARIWAPPRLFFVDTPSAVAADMGCAYTLEVDDSGGSLLRVTSGWVELQGKERDSIVPAGAACETRPGIGPGVPYFEDASVAFRDALKRIDSDSYSASRSTAFATLLSETRKQDTLTLWHLLPRVGEEDRGRLYDKINQYFPGDKDFREAIMQLDDKMLTGWRYQMQDYWFRSGNAWPK
ncbi:MAG TPA: FecR domain-containing protein, partial [Pyrinomonadaceae bacterium]|nr:FecR domain-containing protein [Pyrinomonadaceae bacterium]